jgi:hypothetical protein
MIKARIDGSSDLPHNRQSSVHQLVERINKSVIKCDIHPDAESIIVFTAESPLTVRIEKSCCPEFEKTIKEMFSI